MNFTPTPEQQAICNFVSASPDNLIINARAGAAKTTTLELISQDLKSEALCLAFNKRIATEMAQKMPPSVKCATLNSLGNTALREFLGKWPRLDKGKMFGLLSAHLDDCQDVDLLSTLRENFSDYLTLLNDAKTAGYVPEDNKSLRSLAPDFFDGTDYICEDWERQMIDKLLNRSIKLAMEGTIDFADQLYISTLHPSISFPKYPVVMVDEAQDLSALNHRMLQKILGKRSRLIAVGDEAQAIYAFRGADENSMPRLESMFNMTPMSLTTCFRCAQSIVENARWRAPDMHWAEGAPMGSVEYFAEWRGDYLQPGDAIICRNNAPLFAMALRLMRAGVRPELASGDIFKKVEKVFGKLGRKDISSESALGLLQDYEEKEKKKRRDHKMLDELVSSVRLFLKETNTLMEAKALFKKLAAQKGSVTLITGHRSKGHEWDRVWFLDRELVGKSGQDRNVQYVIETRAKHTLNYVSLEDFS